jgi:hypothetical protein
VCVQAVWQLLQCLQRHQALLASSRYRSWQGRQAAWHATASSVYPPGVGQQEVALTGRRLWAAPQQQAGPCAVQ